MSIVSADVTYIIRGLAALIDVQECSLELSMMYI